MAFMTISGCSLGTPESVKAGVLYALEKLQPRTYFPQHRGGAEHTYAEFAQEMQQLGVGAAIRCAQYRGDMFAYDQNQDL
jgi:hypothetical protein